MIKLSLSATAIALLSTTALAQTPPARPDPSANNDRPATGKVAPIPAPDASTQAGQERGNAEIMQKSQQMERNAATAGSGTSVQPSAVSEEQVVEHLKGEGLTNIVVEKEPQGWTARAMTPDFRPVTIRLDDRGNVLGARGY